MTPPTPSGPPGRLVGLDALRAGAMIAGLFFHATYAYVPGIAPWYPVADPGSHPFFDWLSSFLHAFRMELFFALSGFFAHLLIAKRGPAAFVRDRARRLLVPMLAALPYATVAPWLVESSARAASGASPPPFVPTPSYLWFLEYLFLFSALAALVARWLPRALAGPAGDRPVAAGAALRYVAWWLLPALPALAVAAVGPEGRQQDSFVPQLGATLHYGAFFAAGLLLRAAAPSLGPARAGAWASLAAGLAGAGALAARPERFTASGRTLLALFAWLTVVGALRLALQIRRPPGPAVTLLVDASYWVYLVHYPLVLAFQLALRAAPLPAGAKYAAVVALTGAVSLATYALLVRDKPLGAWLGARASASSRRSPSVRATTDSPCPSSTRAP